MQGHVSYIHSMQLEEKDRMRTRSPAFGVRRSRSLSYEARVAVERHSTQTSYPIYVPRTKAGQASVMDGVAIHGDKPPPMWSEEYERTHSGWWLRACWLVYHLFGLAIRFLVPPIILVGSILVTVTRWMFTPFRVVFDRSRLHSVATGTDAIPIVFLHGLFGFTDTTFFGLGYSQLNVSKGRVVFNVPMPGMSTPDVAARYIYAYLKGGTVIVPGNNGYRPRTFPGVYKQWDENHPIHIIGHSHGGIFAQRLLKLLDAGNVLRASQDRSDDTSTAWVRTCTSIASPFRGTFGIASLLVSPLNKAVLTLIGKMVLWSAGFWYHLERHFPTLSQLYALRLEWIQEYHERPFFPLPTPEEMNAVRNKYKLLYDLMPGNIDPTHKMYDLYDDVYYNSIIANRTFPVPLVGIHVPVTFNPLTLLIGLIIGSQKDVVLRPSDGIVEVVSQMGLGTEPDEVQHMTMGAWTTMGHRQRPGVVYNVPAFGGHVEFVLSLFALIGGSDSTISKTIEYINGRGE